MAINKKYSYKDFTHQDFTDVPASEFNNSEIVGSCFYQEGHPEYKKIYPDGMTGVVFCGRCNLDNVEIPPTCIIEAGCSHRRIKVQNDLEDWVVDGDGKPLEPVNKKHFVKCNLSTDPKDIPIDFIRKEEITKAEYDRVHNKAEFTDWYIDVPIIVNQETRSVRKVVTKYKWDAALDKTIFTKDFDSEPMVEFNGQDLYTIKGNVTHYKVEGKGYLELEGKITRSMSNQPVTLGVFK